MIQYCVECPGSTPIPPSDPCEGCIIAYGLKMTCDESPAPCGGSINVDLSEINNVDVCTDCVPEYSIVSVDAGGIDAGATSITPDGVLTITTGSDYETRKLYGVTYRVKCACQNLSSTNTVYVCLKSPCEPVSCEEGFECNPCSGACEAVEVDLEVEA